jgi:Bacterial Ig-like domain (group 3)/YDG domain/Galactose oxidase, central domain
MQTTPKANNILGHFFALLGSVVMLAIATWVSASSSEQVKPIDNLATPRTGHTATALSDGKILITGGDGDGNLVAASEIFDPETQTSSAGAAMHTARVDHSATLLADGRVLVAGGTGASGALSSAEIFDPAHPENFQTVGSAMSTARTRHTATLLNDGHVLIAGGDAQGTAELFDPATGTFMPTIWPLTVARSGHTATLFTDDSVLLAGGNTATMETYTSGQGFTLDPATMSVVRTGHWAFELSDTRLLLFQGDTGNTIDEFNPGTGTITPKGNLDFHASSSSLLANGKVLVLGAGVAGLYDPDAVPPAPDFTAFDEQSVPGSGVLPRSGQSAVTLPGDKKILITGGVDGSNQLLGQALFNPAKIWTDRDDYMPDDPVIINGSGWQANESIYLFAVDNETEQWTYEMTVNADSNGEFVISPFFIVELRHLGVQFHVTALGAQSTMQADVYFTDSQPGTVSLSPPSRSIAPGGSTTYTATITHSGNNNACGLTFGVTGLPAGASGSFAPNPVTMTNANVTSTLTINTTGATAPGQYTFTVTTTKAANCQGGVGPGPTTTGTLIVTQPPTITSANSTTFTVLTSGQSFQVTATGVPAPTFSFTGTLPSGVTLSSAGLLSGTPAAGTVGSYPITITAQNGISPNATQNFTLIVQKATPTFQALSASQTIVFGQSPITVSGRLNAGTNVVPSGTGTVTVSTASGSIGPFTGNPGNFTNTVNTSAIPVGGPYTITYSYAGNADFNSATDTSTTLTVGKANTSTAITSDLPDPSTTVQSVTVNYTVSVTPPGGGSPTGNVTVSDGVDSCTGTVTAGIGSCNLTLTTVGSRTLTATYAGNSNYNGSTSPGVSHVVNPGTVNTTTTVTSSSPSNTSTYGDNVTFTAKVTAASGTVDPTGTVTFTIDGNAGSAIPLGACSPAVAGTACAQTSTSTLSHNGGVAHIVSAAYTHTGNFVDSNGSLTGGQTVNRKTLTAEIIGDPTRPYNGNTNATLTSANFQLNGLVGTDDFTVTQTAGTYNSKDVVTGDTVTATLSVSDFTPLGGTLADNYNLPTTASGPGHISAAPLTASIIGNPTRPYNCGTVATLTSANFSLSGLIGSENFTVTQTGGAYNSKDVVSATTVTATLAEGDFTPTNGAIATNYVLPTSASGPGQITKVNATINITPYTSPTTVYNCLPHTATGTATGCDGPLAGLDLSGTTHTNAGDYPNDPWTFTDVTGNYNDDSGTVHDSIAKANAVINVSLYHVTFNCNPHTATGTATGACNGGTEDLSSLLDLSGTTHTNAGTYTDTWTFAGNSNYNSDSGSVNDIIDKANTSASVTSTPNPSIVAQPVTFTATVAGTPPVTCVPTGTVTFKDGATTLGSGTLNGSGQATLTTSFATAGSHSITAVYGGNSNFNGSTSATYTQSVQFIFIGFLPPIDNLPTFNSVKAGQTIPVKWQLKDYNGNLISDLGTLASPNGLTSANINCGGGTPDDVEELASPGGTVFRFDGTQFIYNWQTSRPWAGTCRIMTVRLSDGTTHTAQFKFK